MQFESVKPTHCAFTGFGNAVKNFVPLDTFVAANPDWCGIYECNTGTFTKADDVDKKHHLHKNTMFYFYKTIV